MPGPLQEFWQMLQAGGLLALGAGGLASFILIFRRPSSLLPRAGLWSIPWNGWAVLAVFVIAMLAGSLMQSLLIAIGFFEALYGPDFPLALTDPGDDLQRHASHLRGLWSQTLAIPVQFVIIVAGLHFGTGATLAQLGLSSHRLGTNYLLGYLGWLVLTPLSFAVFMAAIALLTNQPQKHPLTDLGNLAGRRELIVFALNAALLAPLLEELLFRGILLPWLLQAESPQRDLFVPPLYRPHLCVGIAVVICLQTPAVSDAMQRQRWGDLPAALLPTFFILALVPAFLLLPHSRRVRRLVRLPSIQAVSAILANGILFAAVHAGVWPSPVPLFVLGTGLAWLAARSRSIVPCIVVHALFNAIAVVFTLGQA